MMEVSIRDALPKDADDIFGLRCDPRLRSMQYAPSPLETPQSVFAVCQPGSEIPEVGFKCSVIMVDGDFAGHIFEEYRRGNASVGTHATLGWNVVPELWGNGIAANALKQLFEIRFETQQQITFVACCFQSNTRCRRVIEKLGFQDSKLGLREFVSHFIKTRGQQRILKHRLSYEMWWERKLLGDGEEHVES